MTGTSTLLGASDVRALVEADSTWNRTPVTKAYDRQTRKRWIQAAYVC